MVTSFSDDAAELAITFFAAGDAAGEGDFGDTRMFSQVLAGLRADPWQDVKHPVRQARFAVNFRQLEAVSGVTSLGLKIIALPAAGAGADFPQGDLDRVVPRADPGYHPQRFATGIDEGTVAQRIWLPSSAGIKPA